ncbi:hypothetical protein KVV02_005591 [Mortierella alpina]|uniref:Uncharacterized protein n=1 Tax=Mortierella alpina TaxID=64518 RepID=A0A9P8CUZ3_MORAP|nr:hypothetical protein KVV02_005591 [Mortierella alpina]
MKHSTVTSSRQSVFRRLKFLASVALGACLLSSTTSAAVNKKKMEFVTADDKSLEPSKDVYDFSEIKKDLEFLNGKKLFVQVQDRFFDPNLRLIPQYLLDDPLYEGGLERQTDSEPGSEGGWTTKQWVPAVRQRFQALLLAMATELDGKVFGVNLPETSIGVNMTNATCDQYFDAEMETALRNYMGQSFEMAVEHGFGVGGPDVRPWKPFQMANSYKFFNQYRNDLSTIAMAVQHPDLRFNNETTGVPFTRNEFRRFAVDYLGANMIFWTSSIF